VLGDAEVRSERTNERRVVTGVADGRQQATEHSSIPRMLDARDVLEYEAICSSLDDEACKLIHERSATVGARCERADWALSPDPPGPVTSPCRVLSIVEPVRGLAEWLTRRPADDDEGIETIEACPSP
jgi:hypothetical protein